MSTTEYGAITVEALEGRAGREALVRRSTAGSAVSVGPREAVGLWPRRLTGMGLALLIAWSLWGATVGRGTLVNQAGFDQVKRFASAALHPEMSSVFLRVVARAAMITAAYALAGTVLAMAIGITAGVLISDTWWASASSTGTRRDRHVRHPFQVLLLSLAVLPRGVHEAIWGLLLIAILGRNPLVAVLAIGIPFGAITAKAVAEAIDDRGRENMAVLRAAGAGRVSALVYGVAPIVGRDVLPMKRR